METLKGPGDLLTRADLASHAFSAVGTRQVLPRTPAIIPDTACIVGDELDGTIPFARGMRERFHHKLIFLWPYNLTRSQLRCLRDRVQFNELNANRYTWIVDPRHEVVNKSTAHPDRCVACSLAPRLSS